MYFKHHFADMTYFWAINFWACFECAQKSVKKASTVHSWLLNEDTYMVILANLPTLFELIKQATFP